MKKQKDKWKQTKKQKLAKARSECNNEPDEDGESGVAGQQPNASAVPNLEQTAIAGRRTRVN
jgi:hypothetical protein